MDQEALRKVLRFDVWASGATAIAVIVGAGLLAGWMEVSAWVLFVAGLVFVLWTLFLIRTVRRSQLRPEEVVWVVAGNLGSFVSGAALVLTFPDVMSGFGRLIVGFFALATLGLGGAEWLGWRKLAPQTVSPTGR